MDSRSTWATCASSCRTPPFRSGPRLSRTVSQWFDTSSRTRCSATSSRDGSRRTMPSVDEPSRPTISGCSRQGSAEWSVNAGRSGKSPPIPHGEHADHGNTRRGACFLGSVVTRRASPWIPRRSEQGSSIARGDANSPTVLRGSGHQRFDMASAKPHSPYRAPTLIWSLLRSLLFRGAMKRLDTPRNG